MTSENFDSAMEHLMNQRPFEIFTIELVGGKRYEIDHPNALSFRHGIAVFISPGGAPVAFDHDIVLQIIMTSTTQTA